MTITSTTRRALMASATTLVASMAFGLGTAGAQQTPGVTDKEIKLGAWVPLTGPVAAYGVPQRAGMEAYLNMVNDQGGVKGRKFNLVVEDNAYNPQRTVAAARKLIDRDGVFALVVPNGTAQTAATFEYVLGEAKVPIINPYGAAIDWYSTPRENLYGAYPMGELQARIIGRWAAKDGHKNIVVLFGAVAAFEVIAKNVEPGAKGFKADTNITMYPVKFGSTDYAPIALDLANKKPDAVIAFLVEQEMVALIKELRQQSFKPQLYTWAPNVSNSLVALAGPGMEGLKAVSYVNPPTLDTPAIKEYRDALAKYAPNEKPDYVSLTSFALTKIFVEAVRRINGPVTRPALVQAMNVMKSYDTGILPPVTYGPDRHNGNSQLHRVQLVNGRWTTSGPPVEAEQAW